MKHAQPLAHAHEAETAMAFGARRIETRAGVLNRQVNPVCVTADVHLPQLA